MAHGDGHEPDERISDVPGFRSTHEGHRIWTCSKPHFDDEPRFHSWPYGLFVEQDRAAGAYARAGTGTGERGDYGERNQPRAVCDGNEFTADEQSRGECAVFG